MVKSREEFCFCADAHRRLSNVNRVLQSDILQNVQQTLKRVVFFGRTLLPRSRDGRELFTDHLGRSYSLLTHI